MDRCYCWCYCCTAADSTAKNSTAIQKPLIGVETHIFTFSALNTAPCTHGSQHKPSSLSSATPVKYIQQHLQLLRHLCWPQLSEQLNGIYQRLTLPFKHQLNMPHDGSKALHSAVLACTACATATAPQHAAPLISPHYGIPDSTQLPACLPAGTLSMHNPTSTSHMVSRHMSCRSRQLSCSCGLWKTSQRMQHAMLRSTCALPCRH
jgi:hypothetical protein